MFIKCKNISNDVAFGVLTKQHKVHVATKKNASEIKKTLICVHIM